jgi:hypothetical protein
MILVVFDPRTGQRISIKVGEGPKDKRPDPPP